MADWGQRPKDRDRDEAIRLIEAAASRGQIIDADRAKRIQEVRSAGSVGEIDMLTRGLAAPEPAGVAPPASPAPPVTTAAPPPNIRYGEPLTPQPGTAASLPPIVRSGGHAGKLVLIVVLIVLAGVAVPVVFGVKALVDTANDAIDDLQPRTVDVTSADGLADLVAAVDDETGSTEVFSATLYDDGYAVLEVPAEQRGQRMLRYYYDGELQQQGKGRSVVYKDRFDLQQLDAEVVEDLLERARKRVEEATSNYLIVHAPTATDQGASLFAYANNDFGEGGYLAAGVDGKVISRVGW